MRSRPYAGPADLYAMEGDRPRIDLLEEAGYQPPAGAATSCSAVRWRTAVLRRSGSRLAFTSGRSGQRPPVNGASPSSSGRKRSADQTSSTDTWVIGRIP